ncbi:hypothetical protein [Streptomyces sp. NPDC048516]|uniref:hypothetical protein n=1 Tax=Streptomyces sp. NPDC048516 TaxID=3365565 RepID=UPI00371E74E9
MTAAGGCPRLTCEALGAASSLGDEVHAGTVVHAVTVVHTDPEDRRAAEALRRDWDLWNPGTG